MICLIFCTWNFVTLFSILLRCIMNQFGFFDLEQMNWLNIRVFNG